MTKVCQFFSSTASETNLLGVVLLHAPFLQLQPRALALTSALPQHSVRGLLLSTLYSHQLNLTGICQPRRLCQIAIFAKDVFALFSHARRCWASILAGKGSKH